MKNKNSKKEKSAKPTPSKIVPFKAPEATGTRLRVGDLIEYNGDQVYVWLRNDSRAAVAPLKSIEYRTRQEDGKLQFYARPERSDDISPNSESKILKSLGREGLAKLIDQSPEQETVSEKGNMKNKNKKENKGKSASKSTESKESNGNGNPGKLGGWRGHSVTSVIRALGKAGWSITEVREFCKQQRIDAAENTMKIQVQRGRTGEGDPAPIAKAELEKLRPEIPEKPAKKTEKGSKESAKTSKGGKDKKKDKGSKKAKPAPVEQVEAEEEVEETEEEGTEEEAE